MRGRIYIYLLAYMAGSTFALTMGSEALPHGAEKFAGGDTSLFYTCTALLSSTITLLIFLRLKSSASKLVPPPYLFLGKRFALSAILTLFLLGAARVEVDSSQLWQRGGGGTRSTPNAAQARIGGYIRSHLGDNGQSAILTAFVTGRKEGIGRETKRTFNKSGAAHLLALSGLHVGILFLILNRISSILSISLGARKIRLFIVGGCTCAFLAVTGFIPSLARAIIMASVCSAARLWGYKISRFGALVMTAFLLVCYNPSTLLSIGFQLSFAAMAGIILILPIMTDNMRRLNLKARIGRGAALLAEKVSGILFVTVSCQITTLPICLFYFGEFSDYYLITNLAAIPLVTLSLYIFAFAAIFEPISPLLPETLSDLLTTFLWSSIKNILQLLESMLEMLN